MFTVPWKETQLSLKSTFVCKVSAMKNPKVLYHDVFLAFYNIE